MSRDFVNDFFDVNNSEHILAYEYLQKYGSWPEEFISGPIVIDMNWNQKIKDKMAKAWVNKKLDDFHIDSYERTEKDVKKKQEESCSCCKEKDYVIDPDLEEQLKIERADNGYVIESYVYLMTDEDEPNMYRKNRHVCDDTYEYYGDEDFSHHDLTDEEIAMFNLLNYIKNYYGVNYNKHKKVNLVIEFEDNEEQEDSSEELSIKLTKEQKATLLSLANRLSESAHQELENDHIIHSLCGGLESHNNITGEEVALTNYIEKLSIVEEQTSSLTEGQKTKLRNLIRDYNESMYNGFELYRGYSWDTFEKEIEDTGEKNKLMTYIEEL